jgi:carbonic anhydrase
MQLNRRDLVRFGASAGLAMALGRLNLDGTAKAAGATSVTPDQALQMLKDGNQRFVSGNAQHPNQNSATIAQIAGGQKPFSAVLSCVDSRVPPEIVFDQGLGDMFTARDAAAIFDDSVLGSLEFGVSEYHIPLLVVMGHQRCGAVAATVDAVKSGNGEAPGQIGAVVGKIAPAVVSVLNSPGDLVDNSVRATVRQSVAQLRLAAPIITDALGSGALKIVGAYYSLDTGAVEFLD